MKIKPISFSKFEEGRERYIYVKKLTLLGF